MSEKFVYGEISFAGIPSVGGSFTLSHGARPSAAVLQFPRNQSIPTVGDMVIQGCDEFGNRASIAFKSCFAASIQASAGGDPLIVARILDRRWAWDFAAISGHYNIRSESGDSIYNEKTPRELAILCLKVMGELNADLGDFDPQGRPPIDWELVNPARALEELVHEFGYIIHLGVNNEVKIVKAGEGSIDFLDRFTWLEDTIGVDMPPRPDGVIIAGGRTLWNMDLWLEPVGLELDGEWKNIEDLSYKPEKGWASTCLPEMPSNLNYPSDADNKKKEEINRLAVEHVYRTHRICVRKPPHFLKHEIPNKPPYGEYMKVVGYQGQIKNRWQLLPLEMSQNLREMKSIKPGTQAGNTLLPTRAAPEIVGIFDSGKAGKDDRQTIESLKSNKADFRTYKLPYSIDYERGLVHFDSLAIVIVENKREPAHLRLRIASGIRDEKTREWIRHTIEHRFPIQHGAGMLVAPHEEIQLRIAPDESSWLPSGKYISNKQDIEREMRYYLNAIVQTMELRASRTGLFGGILPIEPSGRVQQITWNTGTSGPTTQFSANTEHNYNIPSYYERRLMNKLKEDKRKIAVPTSPGEVVKQGAPI